MCFRFSFLFDSMWNSSVVTERFYFSWTKCPQFTCERHKTVEGKTKRVSRDHFHVCWYYYSTTWQQNTLYCTEYCNTSRFPWCTCILSVRNVFNAEYYISIFTVWYWYLYCSKGSEYFLHLHVQYIQTQTGLWFIDHLSLCSETTGSHDFEIIYFQSGRLNSRIQAHKLSVNQTGC